VRTADAGGQSDQAAGSFEAPQSALVIEDLDYNAQAMVAILKMIHCRAETAPTAAIALEKLRKTAFDVVFLDCDLPDMPGPALASAILAENGPHALVPLLIATTAYADNATRERCRKAGMSAFIAKPVTPEKIRAALGSVGKALLSAPALQMRSASLEQVGLDLNQLKLLGDKPSEVRATAQRLCEMLNADMAILRNSCNERDFATARSTAHRIVSHAKFVGAKPLAIIAGEIERSAMDEPEAAIELLASAETHAEDLITKLGSTAELIPESF
jgi:CheY-like chemotaxis protein/HPt (histidine-containing phosphotransfer) domain-containing protein